VGLGRGGIEGGFDCRVCLFVWEDEGTGAAVFCFGKKTVGYDGGIM
jgi:hypothetical protein